MNRSGKSVSAALRYWKIEPEEMLVAHDELDCRPALRGSSSTAATAARTACATPSRLLGHGKFHRLRVGIGHPGHKDKVTPWVLGRPGATTRRHPACHRRASAVLPLAMDRR
jgi:PTH1 family peptidyl-tRNA hydrolase